MPELPEVETIARGVDARVRGDRVVEAWFSPHREPFKSPAPEQAKGLEGRSFVGVGRRGKHIVCAMMQASGGGKRRFAARAGADAADAEWIVHLGMTGRLLVTTPEAPVAAHTHARLRLESGRELRFVDPRRFGRLEFRELESAGEFGAPGAEPLTIGAAEFVRLFRGRQTTMKAALLNQSLLAGVGNIYADEALFRAGIRPRRRAERVTRRELERLREALKTVLEQAIRLGGSSVSDYVDADGVRGFFQLEHCVYQRGGEPCRVCGTAIRRVVVAGRGTHYCPGCQR
jgi:formamidopyrimidine-DNA glycosylase